MYLGLDCSTNCIGTTILNREYQIIDMFFTCNKPEMTFNEKIDNFFGIISEIIDKYRIKSIALEDILMSMTGGNSTYNTMLKLVAFNSIITYLIEKNYPKVELIKILPIVSRKMAWGVTFTEKIYKIVTYDDVPKTSWKKHHIYLHAKNGKYPDIDQYMKYNTKNKFKSENYDCIDSLTMAICARKSYE